MANRKHDGVELTGELCWGEKASSGTMHGRENSILFNGLYDITWNDYSNLTKYPYGKFKYILVEIK